MFEYTDDQAMMRDAVRDFVQAEVRPRAQAIDAAGEVPRELVAKMAELNLLGIPFPEADGGAGGDFVSLTLAIEEVARGSGSLALIVAAHTAMVALPLHRAGSAETKGAWLSRLLSGGLLGGVVLADPNPGGAAPGLASGNRLSGSALPTLVGAAAGLLAVPIGADVALLRADAGVSRKPLPSALGLRASGWAECSFEAVAAEDVLTGASRLLEAAGRTAVAALAVGLLAGTLDRVRPYVLERKQFGKPLASFDPVRAFVAGMAVDLDACRLLVHRAAGLIDEGKDAARAAIVAKGYASDAAFRGARNGVQALGGYGYLTEYEVERCFRDAKFCELALGRTDDLLQGVGREELGA
ncbi:MAG: acyl-CoA dehydrogenase family protein [Planctomycetota bacterium]